MAQSIILTSGTIFNGNPITLAITPSIVTSPDGVQTPTSGQATVPDASASGQVVSMHRIILEVECGMSGGDYEIIKLSSPVITEGREQTIDISSALRTFRDSYDYTNLPTTYPIVKFNVKAYDEYMLNGTVRQEGVVFFPQDPSTLPEDRRDEAYYRTIFGAFADIERITSNATKGVQTLSRKPTTSPQVVKVGERFAYAPPYSTPQMIGNTLVAPESKLSLVSKVGLQTLGYQSVYALPASDPHERSVFRFINGFGVMESVSVCRQHEESASSISTEHVLARQESFNHFSRGVVRKQDGPETWLFSTGPLDASWLRWYIHEFLMSEHIWLQVGSEWLLVHIVPEETTKIKSSIDDNFPELIFAVRFDINGSPLL